MNNLTQQEAALRTKRGTLDLDDDQDEIATITAEIKQLKEAQEKLKIKQLKEAQDKIDKAVALEKAEAAAAAEAKAKAALANAAAWKEADALTQASTARLVPIGAAAAATAQELEQVAARAASSADEATPTTARALNWRFAYARTMAGAMALCVAALSYRFWTNGGGPSLPVSTWRLPASADADPAQNPVLSLHNVSADAVVTVEVYSGDDPFDLATEFVRTHCVQNTTYCGQLMEEICQKAEGGIENATGRRPRSVTDTCHGKATLARVAALMHPMPTECAPKNGIYPAVERVVAIGDIHGDFRAIMTAMRAGRVIKEVPAAEPLSGTVTEADALPEYQGKRFAWAGGKTWLVQLGDFTDKGSRYREELGTLEFEELRILKFLFLLDRQARLAGGRVVGMVGNHELMNVQGDYRYVYPTHLQDTGAALRTELFGPGGRLAKQVGCFAHGSMKIGPWVFVHGALMPEHVSAVVRGALGDNARLGTAAGDAIVGNVEKTENASGSAPLSEAHLFFERVNHVMHGMLFGEPAAPPRNPKRLCGAGGGAIPRPVKGFRKRHVAVAQAAADDAQAALRAAHSAVTKLRAEKAAAEKGGAAERGIQLQVQQGVKAVADAQVAAGAAARGRAAAGQLPPCDAVEQHATYDMCWSRAYEKHNKDGGRTCEQVDGMLDMLSEAEPHSVDGAPFKGAVVVGHTIQDNGIATACGGRVIRADTGMSESFGSWGSDIQASPEAGSPGQKRVEVLELTLYGGVPAARALSALSAPPRALELRQIATAAEAKDRQMRARAAAAAPLTVAGLEVFYRQHDPSKVAKANAILKQYTTAEVAYSLIKKYGSFPGEGPSAAEAEAGGDQLSPDEISEL